MAEQYQRILTELGLPPFQPLGIWRGGDLQTLRNRVQLPRDIIDRWPGTQLLFPCTDGSGDQLCGTLHFPDTAAGGGVGRPLLVLIHGLSGSEDSSCVRVSAGYLLESGYPLLRLNLRGAGRGRALARGTYHAGRSEDLAAVMASLAAELRANGVVAIGFSLGGNLLLKYLAESGSAAGLTGAISISAPIDLMAAQQCIMRRRNLIYHQHLLTGMRAERGHTAKDIRTIAEFDDRVVAPQNGFRDAAHYYSVCSAAPLVTSVRVPTLVVHAADDPWIPAASYERVKWHENADLRLLMPPSGGHVGFHSSGIDRPWHDLAILHFLSRLG
jgi:hypothetical protein